MNKAVAILFLILGAAGLIFGVTMTVMAVSFHEWGRVLFYGMIGLFSVEILIFGILKLKKKT